MQRRNSDYRTYSPMRSPLREQPRQLSPFRNSPYSRQAPMSPLRARKVQKPSTTPTKINAAHRQFYRETKPQQHSTEWVDNKLKSRTIKAGVGLFQQLVNENKLGSERKQNKSGQLYVPPFQLVAPQSKFYNVRHVDSVQNPKPNNNFISSQISSKTDRQSHLESTVKIQHGAVTAKKNIHILDSFGAPKYSHGVQNAIFSKLASKGSKECQPLPQQQQNKAQNQQAQKFIEQQHEPNNSFMGKQNPQAVVQSYSSIFILMKKAQQEVSQDPSQQQMQVKSSIRSGSGMLSFNMNPFL